MYFERTTTRAQEVIDAINSGLKAGAQNDDWDAPEMEEARALTALAGSVWDFAGWRETANCLIFHDGKLGGVQYWTRAIDELDVDFDAR